MNKDYKKTYRDFHPEQMREIDRAPLNDEPGQNWPLFLPYLLLITLVFVTIGAMTGIYFLIRWLS